MHQGCCYILKNLIGLIDEPLLMKPDMRIMEIQEIPYKALG